MSVNELYNGNLKIQFIEERNKEVVLPCNYLDCQFRKVSEMENELEKDVSNFTVYDILEYYKMLNVTSLDSLSVMNSQFSLYTQWCLQHNLVKDNQNHFLEVTKDMLHNCINKGLLNITIMNRKQVLQWCEQLPNPKDQFILLGLFEGIKGKDFCELAKMKPSDISGNIVKLCTGREIQISNKLLNIINDCIEENTYYSLTGQGVKVMPLINRGFIIKDYPNATEAVSEFQIGRKIYNNVSRILNYFGTLDYMSANSVVESGKLDMITEQAKEYKLSKKDYVYSNYIKEVETKYNFKMVRSVFSIKYEDYLLE